MQLLSLIDSKFFSKTYSDVNCGGDWSIAKNLPRKRGTVDETGLEVTTCRHQLGQKALNMKRGELYLYALFLIKQNALPNHAEFIFAEVMCKLWKFMKNVDPKGCCRYEKCAINDACKGPQFRLPGWLGLFCFLIVTGVLIRRNFPLSFLLHLG